MLESWNKEEGVVKDFEVLSLEEASGASASQKVNSEADMLLHTIQAKWQNLKEQMKACGLSEEIQHSILQMPEVPKPLQYMAVPNLQWHLQQRKKVKKAHQAFEDALQESQADSSVQMPCTPGQELVLQDLKL